MLKDVFESSLLADDNVGGDSHISPNIIKKVLLVGYNGANNTGSEARLIAIIEDLRQVLGPEVQITVPTLNEENLRRYLEEDAFLHIAPIQIGRAHV